MLEVSPLRTEDRDRWNVLSRGYKTFYETVLADTEYDRAWERIMSGNSIFGLGARLDGKLVGITHYLFHHSIWMADICYLQDLFVDHNVRGQGVARALIDRVAEHARKRGAPRLYWLTRNDNTTARTLYDKVASHKGFIRYDY